ncbi:Arginyl-tRNA synthetase [Rhizophlyctis rosea]|uniref:arginine--tRNA ligase n=1 Tax=Rhizophlyctis rosea TaxID=64517 RepID=A0AAD5X6F5_9FUNG|nr:Arginyl-tRNA synthetase [Rhizophlyctis rosea]
MTDAHANTLYLSFSPVCLPYAEVATYNLATSTQQSKPTLRLGLAQDLLSLHPTLVVPAGPLTTDKVKLVGKSSITRFFARAFKNGSSLYDEKPALQYEADKWFDAVRAGKGEAEAAKVADAIKAAASSAGDKFLLQNGAVTVADLLAWDAVRTQCAGSKDNKGVASWISAVEAVPGVKGAVELVDAANAKVHQLDVFRYEIIKQVSALTGASGDAIYPLLEEPRDAANGDLSLPLPRLKLPGNPVQIAKDLATNFKTNTLITKAASAGPFLNFSINREILRDRLLPSVLIQESNYGRNASGFGNLAIVEFSSPNIAKPFHAGHLRSTIIGNFIKNVLESAGWATVSINYLGDWGKQYGLLAVGFEQYGSDEELERDPIRHLFDVYVNINRDAEAKPEIHDQARDYFKRMEDGETDALGLWQKFRNLSIVKYKDIYARLNVSFDIYSGESQYSLNQMRNVLEELNDLSLLKPDAGALIVDLKQHKLGTAIIGKTNGSMLYLSRDIAAAIDRQNYYKFDEMFYVVGSQQDHHFRQLFKILELMGKPWSEHCHHINFGMVKSKDGNMSTRKGTVVFLQDILDNVKGEMHEVMKKNENKYAQIEDPEMVSDLVGISAIVVQDMAARRVKDYELDWNRMLSFEGDSGPYLQFAHSRLCSIERKAGFEVSPSVDYSLLTERQAHDLVDIISRWPDVVRDVTTTLEPCNVVSYSLKLSHAVSSALDVLWVMGQERPLAEARLALYRAARITLGNALRSIGLKPLERM